MKNIGKAGTAARVDINEVLCRPLSPVAQVVRFCSAGHKKLCTTQAQGCRGQREALDIEQYALLFHAFVKMGCPWAAVLSLVQLVCAERADCTRNARVEWFQHFDPKDAQPPTIRIPRVNGKTKAREIPVAPKIAELVHHWQTHGLRAPTGEV